MPKCIAVNMHLDCEVFCIFVGVVLILTKKVIIVGVEMTDVCVCVGGVCRGMDCLIISNIIEIQQNLCITVLIIWILIMSKSNHTLQMEIGLIHLAYIAVIYANSSKLYIEFLYLKRLEVYGL